MSIYLYVLILGPSQLQSVIEKFRQANERWNITVINYIIVDLNEGAEAYAM